MKKRILPLLLSVALLLSGCASMTNKDYLSIQPHMDNLTTEEDPTVFRVESYTRMVDVIHSMVETGTEHGVIHLFNYVPQNDKDDVETDIADACAEVAQHDPLGAYAVDFIKHDKSYIVSYYEANIYITYRRTPEQVKNIVAVTGSSAVRTEIQEALASFSTEKVLRISYFTEDADGIKALIGQAYYASPQFALGMPEIEVNLYPSDGTYADPLRIVEILLTYPENQETLRTQALELSQRAEGLGVQLLGLGREAAAREVERILKAEAAYVPPGQKDVPQRRNTAYAALVDGSADSEGLALAFQLLCGQAGIESYVVSGGVNETPHFWNIVALPDGEYRHVDVTADEGFGLSDAELVALGYVWDRTAYRACGAQPPTEETPLPEAEQNIDADIQITS